MTVITKLQANSWGEQPERPQVCARSSVFQEGQGAWRHIVLTDEGLFVRVAKASAFIPLADILELCTAHEPALSLTPANKKA